MNRWLTVTALALLALGVGNAQASASEFPDYLMAGMQLTAKEAEGLEARLKTDPRDVRGRSELIVHYFQKAVLDPAIRRTRNLHVLWLIRNAPHADALASPHAEIQPFFDQDSYDSREVSVAKSHRAGADQCYFRGQRCELPLASGRSRSRHRDVTKGAVARSRRVQVADAVGSSVPQGRACREAVLGGSGP